LAALRCPEGERADPWASAKTPILDSGGLGEKRTEEGEKEEGTTIAEEVESPDGKISQNLKLNSIKKVQRLTISSGRRGKNRKRQQDLKNFRETQNDRTFFERRGRGQ